MKEEKELIDALSVIEHRCHKWANGARVPKSRSIGTRPASIADLKQVLRNIRDVARNAQKQYTESEARDE